MRNSVWLLGILYLVCCTLVGVVILLSVVFSRCLLIFWGVDLYIMGGTCDYARWFLSFGMLTSRHSVSRFLNIVIFCYIGLA